MIYKRKRGREREKEREIKQQYMIGTKSQIYTYILGFGEEEGDEIISPKACGC